MLTLENLALYCIFMVNSVYMLEGQIVLPTRDIFAESSINPMKTKPNSFLRPCASLEFGNFNNVLAKYVTHSTTTNSQMPLPLGLGLSLE